MSEESFGPTFFVVVPEWAEGFLEKVSCVPSLIRGQQLAQCSASITRQIVPMGEPGVLLALDGGAGLAGQSGLFPLADRVEGFAQMA